MSIIFLGLEIQAKKSSFDSESYDYIILIDIKNLKHCKIVAIFDKRGTFDYRNNVVKSACNFFESM